MSTPDIDISQQCDDWPDVEALIHAATHALFKVCPSAHADAELSVVLADDEFIQTLNAKWRDQDKPTNVLSFPQDHLGILGDVILALETIQRESDEQNKSFDDHLSHLTVHGILHLLGYDHEDPAEAEEMEALEIEILDTIDVKNPYADTDSVS